MRKATWLLAAVLLSPAVVSAQAPVTGPNVLVAWEQDTTDLTTAQGYTYNYSIDAGSYVVLPSHKCGTTATTGVFTCVAPMPATTAGPHSIALTAANIAGTSLPSTPLSFVMVLVPSAPRNLRFVSTP
jgi:hypothetical protein